MLKLLRKYQKAIFAVVAFMVIASFSFFGTYGAIQADRPKEEDVVIGRMLDGSNLSSKNVAQLIRFLDTDFHDVMNGYGRGSANLLNDGVIRNDIIKSGLGDLIFDAYKTEIWEELSKKTRKFKEFKPYIHPSKFLSFEGMLSQFAPNYHEDLQNFRAAREESDAFKTLAKLYVDQTVFPAEMMRQMMLYVEQQYANRAAGDPNLRNIDLSLFYAKNVTDWFGQKFLEKVAHFILNGASYAEMRGYKVTVEEARSSLLQMGARHLKELDPKRVITTDELNKFYKQQILQLQMEERDLLKTWQNILVLRKMLNDVGHSVFVDSVLYKQFNEFASKGAKIEVYKLPAALKFNGQEDGLKLKMYLEGVSKKKGEAQLSNEFASLEEIKTRAPELVEKRFLLKVASLKKGLLESEIGVRKTWDWQLNQDNWDALSLKFQELSKCTSLEREDRFAFLQSLDEKLREKIDQYSRKIILDEDPDLIVDKLLTIQPQTRLISITLAGQDEILPGVFDRKALLDLIEQESEKLTCYSENGEDFYHIEIVDKSSLWEVLTFEEAKTRGILDNLKEGKVSVNNSEVLEKTLIPYMNKVIAEVIKGDEGMVRSASNSSMQDSLEPKSPLENQWCIQKDELTVSRKMAHPIFNEKLFLMESGQWSEVISTSEGPLFFHVLETYIDASDVARKMEEGRALLGKEAKEELVKGLLQQIVKNGS